MWNVFGANLQMTEGDYGVALPITIAGTTLGENDCIKLIIKDKVNGDTILEKDFADISENTVSLQLTAEETLPVGIYVYSLDWYQSGSFMCNIIPSAQFKVVDKA